MTKFSTIQQQSLLSKLDTLYEEYEYLLDKNLIDADTFDNCLDCIHHLKYPLLCNLEDEQLTKKV